MYERLTRIGGRAYFVDSSEASELGDLEENLGGYRWNAKEHVLINAVTKTVFNVPSRCFSLSSYVNQSTNCPADQDPVYVYARGLWMTPAQQANSANWIYHNLGSTSWTTAAGRPNPNRIAVNTAFPFMITSVYPNLANCVNDTARWEAVHLVLQRMQACNPGDCFVPGQEPNKVPIKFFFHNMFTEDFFALDDLYGLNYLSRSRYANSIYSAGTSSAIGFGLTGCGGAPFEVVREGGGRKGYATVPILMAQDAATKQGVSLSTFVSLDHELYSIRKIGNRYSLRFTNGKIVIAKKVILNMGMHNVKRLDRINNPLFDLAGTTLKAIYGFTEMTSSKTFLHYDLAWWIKAGLTKGLILTDEAFKHMRFHQGHVTCSNPSDVNTCHGLFLASYQIAQFHEHKGIDFFKEGPYAPSNLYVLRRSSARDAYVLDMLHNRLMLIISNLLNTSSIAPPTYGIYGNWVDDPYMRKCHQGVTGVPAGEQELVAIRPIPTENIFVAQIDWMSSYAGFAEASLVMGERVVHRFFGVPKPTWLPDPWYTYNVQKFNN
jgi:hypothetical protein